MEIVENHIAAFAQERSMQLPLRTMTVIGIENHLQESDATTQTECKRAVTGQRTHSLDRQTLWNPSIRANAKG